MNGSGPDPRLLSRLAGKASHDLNNALAVFSGHIYLLRAEAEPPEEAFQAMEKVLEHLQRLSASLAAVGSLAPAEAAPVDVNDAVTSASAATPRVDLELEPGLPLLRACRADLERAVSALLVNASEASGPAERVLLRTLSDPDRGVRIRVEDRGKGVPADVRRRRFEPLYSTSGMKGRGIGITLAAAVAAELGGTLAIDDVSGGGTCATLRLPASERESPNQS
ncbi:MAG: HAMP domain-containing histidine kinase [Acidobacteriota bacterium]|nr:HAMP domain-containing histidine kinase [Acidobacteriota bacterium]